MIWLLLPYPSPPPLIRIHRKIEKERQLADGRGGKGDGRGAKSYERKKAWSSINHSIPSEQLLTASPYSYKTERKIHLLFEGIWKRLPFKGIN
jgi:hypothetical protein